MVLTPKINGYNGCVVEIHTKLISGKIWRNSYLYDISFYPTFPAGESGVFNIIYMDKSWYIKIYRKLFDSKIFLDKPSEWLKIWIFILWNVNFSENWTKEGSKFMQYAFIAQECRLTYKQVEKCICWLKKESMINIERRPNGGIIEVYNWCDYQGKIDTPKGNQKGIRRECNK